jgi:hypothetical protein
MRVLQAARLLILPAAVPLAAVLLPPLPAVAASPNATRIYRLDSNDFRCESCVPPFTVKADGADHPVRGQGYDTVAVSIIRANTVKITYKQAGRVVSTETATVPPGGRQGNSRSFDIS